MRERMICHAVRPTAFVVILSLAVLGSPVQAQDEPTPAQVGEAVDLTPDQIDRQRRAEQGDADAQYRLGLSYNLGLGVPADASEAVAWYRRAAEQGHAGAQLALGNMFAIGRGVPKDDAAAIVWYRRAGEQGDASVQYLLGDIFAGSAGSGGVPQDFVEAVAWYRRAA